jgi:hypothetical protein
MIPDAQIGDRKGAVMPVTIETFEVMPEDASDELRRQTTWTTNPAMVALLAEVEAGQPVRVRLVDGQSARGLRTAISRAAGNRGITVETVTGDGFVAVKRLDQPRGRKTGSGSGSDAQRRGGRSLKRPASDSESSDGTFS